jgi:hypothetical protein
MARVATVTAVLLLAVLHAAMSVTVQEFFPIAKNNLTLIKWNHKTNSQAELKKALESNETMMIEADVIMGNVTNGLNTTATNVPIMAHPPAASSDLSLEEFLRQVLDNKKKGIKLDFKTIQAVEASVLILQNKNLTVPVWLNADILKGPVNGTGTAEPVDPKRFLDSAAKLPQALLSIGWTTSDPVNNQNATTEKYTNEQVTEIVKYLQNNKINQSVTYPVRACYAANDAAVLKNLLSNSKAQNPTLTVWSAVNDVVDADKLSEVINSVGLDKVYVDVPDSLWQKLKLSSSAYSAQSSLSVVLTSLFAGLIAVKLL